MRSVLAIILPVIMLLLFGCLSQLEPQPANITANATPVATQQAGTFHNIQYSQLSKALVMDIYLPQGQQPYPTIIYVHGGGWERGSRRDCPSQQFIARGYAVVCIDYRLSGEAKFPAQIQDVKAALRWLRANADRYAIDAGRFGIYGDSAGGHLAALAGTSGSVSKFDTDENNQYSSRVQAVVDWFGPVSFVPVENITGKHEKYYEYNYAGSKLLGGPILANHDRALEANPAAYASSDDPPFLIMHGEDDVIVPVSESRLLYDALRSNGVDATLVILKGLGHSFGDAELGQAADFFDRHLKIQQ